MTEHEEHPLEFLPELALGVLSDADAATIRAHIAGCDVCSEEFGEMERVARLLPLAVEAHEPDPALKSGVMERIAAEQRTVPVAPSLAVYARVVPFRQRPLRWVMSAAAAAIVLAAGSGLIGWAARGSGADGDLRAEKDRQDQLLAAVVHGTSRSNEVMAGDLRAVVLHAPGSAGGYTFVQGLPALPAGKAYQAWFTHDDTLEPGAVFSVGHGAVWLEADGPLERYDAIAFTIEDHKGATKPSGPPFVTVSLQRAARR